MCCSRSPIHGSCMTDAMPAPAAEARGLGTAPAEETLELPARSPWQIFWSQFRRSQAAVAGGVLLAVLYALALFAPFPAPYPQDEMDRERFFPPPQALHWVDAHGRFHLPPYIHPTRLTDPGSLTYVEDPSRVE